MRLGLRQAISLSSFKDYILKDVIDYYSNDNIIREVNTFQAYHDYPIEIFYLSCLSFSIILFISSFERRPWFKRNEKLRAVQDKDLSRCINVFLIIFTMIFTKNIENAI